MSEIDIKNFFEELQKRIEYISELLFSTKYKPYRISSYNPSYGDCIEVIFMNMDDIPYDVFSTLLYFNELSLPYGIWIERMKEEWTEEALSYAKYSIATAEGGR